MKTNTYDAEDRIAYDRTRDAYRTRVGPDESLSMGVFELVATALDRDPVDLPPLGERIDTDALDSLFPAQGNGAAGTEGVVEFAYAGCRVAVFADRHVLVEPE